MHVVQSRCNICQGNRVELCGFWFIEIALKCFALIIERGEIRLILHRVALKPHRQSIQSLSNLVTIVTKYGQNLHLIKCRYS